MTPTCDQCGDRNREVYRYDPYGWLCRVCWVRQAHHDERSHR